MILTFNDSKYTLAFDLELFSGNLSHEVTFNDTLGVDTEYYPVLIGIIGITIILMVSQFFLRQLLKDKHEFDSRLENSEPCNKVVEIGLAHDPELPRGPVLPRDFSVPGSARGSVAQAYANGSLYRDFMLQIYPTNILNHEGRAAFQQAMTVGPAAQTANYRKHPLYDRYIPLPGNPSLFPGVRVFKDAMGYYSEIELPQAVLRIQGHTVTSNFALLYDSSSHGQILSDSDRGHTTTFMAKIYYKD